jgi:hypothetical protein
MSVVVARLQLTTPTDVIVINRTAITIVCDLVIEPYLVVLF